MKGKKMKIKKTIILDMDGTLYQFKGGTFKSSGLYKIVRNNTITYISKQLKKSKVESRQILDSIITKYNNATSIGLEKDFKLDRYEYFNSVWNIDPEKFLSFDPGLKQLLNNLKKTFNLVLLSDAPRVWIDKVLTSFEIINVFEKQIFSGESDTRKEFGNAFSTIIETLKLKAEHCISVGDQEETDIIPANKLGMTTIYVGNNRSDVANYNIKSVLQILEILEGKND